MTIRRKHRLSKQQQVAPGRRNPFPNKTSSGRGVDTRHRTRGVDVCLLVEIGGGVPGVDNANSKTRKVTNVARDNSQIMFDSRSCDQSVGHLQKQAIQLTRSGQLAPAFGNRF